MSIRTEIVTGKLADGRVQTSKGVRSCAGNSDIVVGRPVTVIGDLITGWRRRASGPQVVTRTIRQNVLYHFADPSDLVMNYVDDTFTTVTKTTNLIPPDSSAHLIIHCYNATVEYLVWIWDAVEDGYCRVLIQKNDTTIANFTSVISSIPFMPWNADAYIDASNNLQWFAQSIGVTYFEDGSLPAASAYPCVVHYDNGDLVDSVILNVVDEIAAIQAIETSPPDDWVDSITAGYDAALRSLVLFSKHTVAPVMETTTVTLLCYWIRSEMTDGYVEDLYQNNSTLAVVSSERDRLQAAYPSREWSVVHDGGAVGGTPLSAEEKTASWYEAYPLTWTTTTTTEKTPEQHIRRKHTTAGAVVLSGSDEVFINSVGGDYSQEVTFKSSGEESVYSFEKVVVHGMPNTGNVISIAQKGNSIITIDAGGNVSAKINGVSSSAVLPCSNSVTKDFYLRG